jgi:hypothetical protein
MLLFGLLSTVVDSLTGEENQAREGSKELDGRNIGAGVGRTEHLLVSGQKKSHGFVAALAEEVGFADGFVGERRVEGQRRTGEQQCQGSGKYRRA